MDMDMVVMEDMVDTAEDMEAMVDTAEDMEAMVDTDIEVITMEKGLLMLKPSPRLLL